MSLLAGTGGSVQVSAVLRELQVSLGTTSYGIITSTEARPPATISQGTSSFLLTHRKQEGTTH